MSDVRTEIEGEAPETMADSDTAAEIAGVAAEQEVAE